MGRHKNEFELFKQQLESERIAKEIADRKNMLLESRASAKAGRSEQVAHDRRQENEEIRLNAWKELEELRSQMMRPRAGHDTFESAMGKVIALIREFVISRHYDLYPDSRSVRQITADTLSDISSSADWIRDKIADSYAVAPVLAAPIINLFEVDAGGSIQMASLTYDNGLPFSEDQKRTLMLGVQLWLGEKGPLLKVNPRGKVVPVAAADNDDTAALTQVAVQALRDDPINGLSAFLRTEYVLESDYTPPAPTI